MIKSFEKFAQAADQRNKFSFGNIHSLLEDMTLLCLQISKLEQLDCKRFFDGAFANSCYSMLGLGNVKNAVVKKTIYARFIHKFLRYLVKRTQVAQTGNSLFERQLVLVSKIMQNDFISGVAIKAMRIG